MATVSPRPPVNRADTDRRVRHPLQSLRGYIRLYVLLEGAAIALLFVALWFWLSLALDYGAFKLPPLVDLAPLDWIEELEYSSPESAFLIRAVLLGLVLTGLLAVVAFKVVRRLFREFSDAALALVLERRFPKELGDRLITAVELAGPRLAEKYGYSQALVDQTIADAAERVEKVPIREVFNWRRLARQITLACFCSVGVYLLTALGFLFYAMSTEAAPNDFFWRFNNVAAIWFERHVLLRNSYWPRRSYLEVIRFQDSEGHRYEMRAGRDEQRPDVQVRAIEWVIADREAPDGWRALRWQDLPDLLSKDFLQVPLPDAWQGWLVDFDDLDPDIPISVIPAEWQGKTTGYVRQELAKPEVRNLLANAGALQQVEQLLDWRNWTVDRIHLQLGRTEVSHSMRSAHFEARKQFEAISQALTELAESPSLSRRLRKLEIPDQVLVYYRGKTTKSSSAHEWQADNKYSIGLNDLKESVRFTVRGEDYYTLPRSITLVPPPTLASLTVNKEEPAYIYYRLQGDQTPLKGRKQLFHNVPVSLTGESSGIVVPLGTNLQVTATADRPLKEGIRLVPPAARKVKGSITPAQPVHLQPDGKTFVTAFPNVVRAIEFELHFNDQDNVKGRRHVVIEPVDDKAPQEVANVELTVVLRKPRFRSDPGKSSLGGSLDGYLITPDALLPLKGILRDDYGLTNMEWTYEVEEVQFELIGQSSVSSDARGKTPDLVLGGNARLRQTSMVVSGLQTLSGVPAAVGLAPAYWAWLERMVAFDLAQSARKVDVVAGTVPMEIFRSRLQERAQEEVPLNALEQKLRAEAPRKKLFSEHSLHPGEEFDFQKSLPKLKARDQSKDPQLHYRVRLSVAATDNNVETGPGTMRNKMPLNFLIVSENELLAQILVEEETMRERLEKAVDKLKNSKTILEEQVSKLATPQPPLSLVGLRADEVRKTLMDTASTTREVSADYNRILREMEANRVEARRVENVRGKICKPLEDVINPNFGEFGLAETTVVRLWEAVEEDVARLKKAEDSKLLDAKLLADLEANRAGHFKLATQSREQMTRLIDKLEQVLQAIGGEIVEREIIALLLQIERDQRQQAERLRVYHDEEIHRLFRELTDPQPNEKR